MRFVLGLKLTNHKILLCCVHCGHYHANETKEFCWVTGWGYILSCCSVLGPLGLRTNIWGEIVTEICPMHHNEQFKVPCLTSGCTKAQNNNQTHNCCQQKKGNVDESTTKLTEIGRAQGTGPAVLNR